MAIKILQPAVGKHGAAIIGVNGSLRLVDRKQVVCHGKQNGCLCENCRPGPRKLAVGCVCRSPWRDDEGSCGRCGRRILPLRAA